MNRPEDEDDAALFRAAMADARPLKNTPSARFRPPRRPDANQLARRSAALGQDPDAALPVSTWVPERRPEEVLDHRGDGIQATALRKLRQGRLLPEATLDLHGVTLNEASRILPAFIEEALRREYRVICVVHGKGGRRAAGDAPMKTQVSAWLQALPGVLAFHSAPPSLGGNGAALVLLRRMRSAADA